MRLTAFITQVYDGCWGYSRAAFSQELRIISHGLYHSHAIPREFILTSFDYQLVQTFGIRAATGDILLCRNGDRLPLYLSWTFLLTISMFYLPFCCRLVVRLQLCNNHGFGIYNVLPHTGAFGGLLAVSDSH